MRPAARIVRSHLTNHAPESINHLLSRVLFLRGSEAGMAESKEAPEAAFHQDIAVPAPDLTGDRDVSRGKVPDAVVEAIIEALRGVKYGQVTVTVQDGQVVQIDRMERRRLKS